MARFICCLFPPKIKSDTNKNEIIIDTESKREYPSIVNIEPYIKEVGEGQRGISKYNYPNDFTYHLSRIEIEKETGITDTCPICLEEFTVKLPIRNCQHKYHNHCVGPRYPYPLLERIPSLPNVSQSQASLWDLFLE